MDVYGNKMCAAAVWEKGFFEVESKKLSTSYDAFGAVKGTSVEVPAYQLVPLHFPFGFFFP